MFDVIRAWKDEEYRLSLSDEELRHLPPNPVGEMELTDADLEAVYGGRHGSFGYQNQSQVLICISHGNNCYTNFSICLHR